MPQQRPTQNSSLLTDLPLELRDMIYDQVFADDSEIVIPHPLMQTSKQLRQEVTQTAARKIGPRAKLNLAPRFYPRDHEVYTSITMDDWQATDTTYPPHHDTHFHDESERDYHQVQPKFSAKDNSQKESLL